MQVSKSERPGVYSSYSTSTISGTVAGDKSVGIVATNEVALGNMVHTVTSVEEAEEIFGTGVMADLIEMALKNGALSAACVAVAETLVETEEEDTLLVAPDAPHDESQEGVLEETLVEHLGDGEPGDYLVEEIGSYSGTEVMVVEKDYEGAFALLEAEEGLAMILCDSTDLTVQQLLRDSVVRASESRKERIGIVAVEKDATASEACAQAKLINSERMVLVGGKYSSEDAGILYAAAVAGVLATESDPALPLNGLSLSYVEAMDGNYTDSEVDLLLTSGVLPLEQSGGTVTMIRGVTTCTEVAGVADSTWRDLTTIMVVDDVIPTLRNLLKVKFQRAKNTDLTRGSIRSEVVMALDRKLSDEIIVEYGDISVEASDNDASICVVSFSFAVAHGLNQIWLTANVQV